MNGTARTRQISSIVNQNQGGGNKKAGFPGIVGRDSWVSIFYDSNGVRCCTLSGYNKNRLSWTVSPTRPVGIDSRIPMR